MGLCLWQEQTAAVQWVLPGAHTVKFAPLPRQMIIRIFVLNQDTQLMAMVRAYVTHENDCSVADWIPASQNKWVPSGYTSDPSLIILLHLLVQ